ncbi:MAG: AraC family transcriptional regulator [Bradyrhizobiaceae bacterium]|nr:AraC family transcriptional regulator [Bradyrhizobiaceae bacterium]
MTKPETRIDYGRRVARVSEHIAGNLDAILDVEQLAAVAYFSPWHFHRIYRETTGETVADTVRRLRLHRAAVELTRDTAPLERIAKRAGYGTLAAFSRAFAADYGVPPGAYRQRGRLLPPSPQQRKEPVVMYEVEIAPFAGVRLAAVEHRGDYQEIGRAFDRIFAWAAPRGLLGPATRSIGIYYDDPESVPLKELRADAGLVVAADVQPEGDLRMIEIPSLLCASVVHKGPYAELERPYRFLFREWLPKSGRDPADHPCFEEYLNNPRELPPSEWLTRVYLPVRP